MGPGLAIAWWAGMYPLPNILEPGLVNVIPAVVILIGTRGLLLSLFFERRIEFDYGAGVVRFLVATIHDSIRESEYQKSIA